MSDNLGSSYQPVPMAYELVRARLTAGATPDEASQHLVRHSISGAAAAAIVARVLPEVQQQRARDNQLKMYLGWLVMAGSLQGALAADCLRTAGVLRYAAGVAFVTGLLLFLISWRASPAAIPSTAAGRRMARDGWVL